MISVELDHVAWLNFGKFEVIPYLRLPTALAGTSVVTDQVL